MVEETPLLLDLLEVPDLPVASSLHLAEVVEVGVVEEVVVVVAVPGALLQEEEAEELNWGETHPQNSMVINPKQALS